MHLRVLQESPFARRFRSKEEIGVEVGSPRVRKLDVGLAQVVHQSRQMHRLAPLPVFLCEEWCVLFQSPGAQHRMCARDSFATYAVFVSLRIESKRSEQHRVGPLQ